MALPCQRRHQGEAVIPADDPHAKLDPHGVWQFSQAVHRIGFDAVDAVLARYGQASDPNLGIRIPGEEPGEAMATPPDGAMSRHVLDDTKRALDAWFDLMSSSFEAARDHMTTTMSEWAGGAPSSGPVDLPDTPPGRHTAANLWIRLTAPGITGRYSVESDGLVGPGGYVIPPEMMAVSPDSFALISGIKQSVELKLAIPQSAPAGGYRGHLRVPHAHISSDGTSTDDIHIPVSIRVAAA